MNEEVEEGPGAAAVGDVVEITDRTYRREYYKRNNSWGVNQKFASKRQIFSVGGIGAGKTKAALKKIVDKAIQKMEKGASEESAKEWAQGEADK